MKNDLLKVVDDDNKEHDSDKIKPSTLFKTRTKKGIKRKKLNNLYF